jgi:pSer/pThr/pTyr-binding forkhead associated (FHA) protein/pimeloyl-ACP methyl ester carboxylesterase
MEGSFGKLTLIQQGGPETEFELGKTNISLGRATTNDIFINDGRISRNHARIECNPHSCTLFDTGSINGTFVNDARIDRAILQPGDVITLGGSTLRFDLTKRLDEPEMTVIDSEDDLAHSLEFEVLPVVLNETKTSRLVVHTPEQTREISLEDLDQISIGRTEENDLLINHPKVSRKHAEVRHEGGGFILRDLNSTNGTWMSGERINQVVLEDGDQFLIGNAQILFKKGFAPEALTMIDQSPTRQDNRRLVIFVPGLMGSQLYQGSERLWPDVKTIVRHPELLRLTQDTTIQPRGIVEEVVIVPNLVKLDQYNRVGDYLVEELGYQRGVDFFEFAYDWRQDVRISARKLAELVDVLPRNRPLVLIGHSLGTMVSRYYVERLGGKQRVERVILLGGPHQGAVKGLAALLVGPNMLPFGIMGERLRQVCMSFVSSYQILPTYPMPVDAQGTRINFLEDETWLDEKYLPLLRLGRQFRQELGTRSSIPAVSIFGYGIKTAASIRIGRGKDGRINQVDVTSDPSGDATILERSALLEGSEIHPVQQFHGSLFVDNDVKMRLKVELTRPY